MDGFSAKCLLEMSRSDNDGAADLYKALKAAPDSGGPTEASRAFFKANEGRSCLINHTGYTGKLIELNESTGGFYPGECYPFYVEITGSSDPKFLSAVGSVFEYDGDQLTILPETA